MLVPLLPSALPLTVNLHPHLPPHLFPSPHLLAASEDEWWIPTSAGQKVRIHAQRAGSPLKTYRPGEIPFYLPGLPPVDVGSIEVPFGSIAYSPANIPHTYKG